MRIRTIEELDPLERLALIDMSYSRISTYEMCPTKYYFSYIYKAPRVFSAPASLGNMIHYALEHHVGDDDELDLAELNKLYEHSRGIYDPGREIDDELINAGYSMLSEFVDRHDEEEFDVLGKEIDFQFVLGSALVRGYIDRVDIVDKNTLHVIDYKSGKFQVKSKEIDDNTQLMVYAIALSILYPDVDRFISELYYLRTGDRVRKVFTRDQLPEIADEVHRSIVQIITDIQFRSTDAHFMCTWCDHAKTGECKTGVSRSSRFSRRRKK